MRAVQALRQDIETHVSRLGHDPLVEAIRTLSTGVARDTRVAQKDDR